MNEGRPYHLLTMKTPGGELEDWIGHLWRIELLHFSDTEREYMCYMLMIYLSWNHLQLQCQHKHWRDGLVHEQVMNLVIQKQVKVCFRIMSVISALLNRYCFIWSKGQRTATTNSIYSTLMHPSMVTVKNSVNHSQVFKFCFSHLV